MARIQLDNPIGTGSTIYLVQDDSNRTPPQIVYADDRKLARQLYKDNREQYYDMLIEPDTIQVNVIGRIAQE